MMSLSEEERQERQSNDGKNESPILPYIIPQLLGDDQCSQPSENSTPSPTSPASPSSENGGDSNSVFSRRLSPLVPIHRGNSEYTGPASYTSSRPRSERSSSPSPSIDTSCMAPKSLLLVGMGGHAHPSYVGDAETSSSSTPPSTAPALTQHADFESVQSDLHSDTQPPRSIQQYELFNEDGEFSEDENQSSQRVGADCCFKFLDCQRVFYRQDLWQEHSLTHFRMAPPPTVVSCPFCPWKAREASKRSEAEKAGHLAWNARMDHVYLHHRQGRRLIDAEKPYDIPLAKHLWKYGLIDEEKYKDLIQRPSAEFSDTNVDPCYTISEGPVEYRRRERR